MSTEPGYPTVLSGTHHYVCTFGFGRRFSGLGKPQKVFRDKKHLFFAVCLSKPQRNGDFFIKIIFCGLHNVDYFAIILT
jgi:hypothetical protein